jgi:hypothetical protein
LNKEFSMKSKIALAVLGAALIVPTLSFAADTHKDTSAQSVQTQRSESSQNLIQEGNAPGGVGG